MLNVYRIHTMSSDVGKFLQRKFWEWQDGEIRTQKEFAEYLGVREAALSHWINGARKPDYESALELSSKLGAEVFDVCGYMRPDPQLQALIAQWDHLSSTARLQILQDAGVEVDVDAPERSKSDKNHSSMGPSQ